uniref:PDEase domain-containing protein n=1 Tax=Oreochromis aureus TaxID=47969 RepID=A0A668VIJ9_OREAU
MGVRGGKQDKRHTVEENQRLFINLARFLQMRAAPFKLRWMAICCRLRCLVKQLEKGEASVVELKKNLEFAACLLESLCSEENRQLGNQDDELSDIQSDSVPLEVRDWLASTFTRQRTLLLHHSEDKPHFRSIVRAVQAGIFVERMFRRTSNMTGLSYSLNIITMLKHVDMWSFDVFALNDASGNHALKIVFFELLNRYNLINRFKVNSNKDSFHVSFK